MSKPRITLTLSDNGSFCELYLNEAGRDLLVRQLQAMDGDHEHLHLGPDDFSDLQMSSTPYTAAQTAVQYGKIYLRKDEWDAQYFPHVMASKG
jgi:hypothetical protein